MRYCAFVLRIVEGDQWKRLVVGIQRLSVVLLTNAIKFTSIQSL